MKARVLRPAITFTTVVAVLVAALAAYAFLSAGASHADSVYTPTTKVYICNALPPGFSSTDASLAGTGPGCTETLTAGTATDYTTELDMAATNLNFSNVVTFSPNAPTAVATGTKVGGLRSLTNLGLINAPCTTALTVDFVLYNTALPNAATRAAMTNIAWPLAPGSSDRFGRWVVGGGTHTSSPGAPSFSTDPEWAPAGAVNITSGNGTNADGTTLSIANYPIYLLDAFDPDFVPGVSDGAAQPKIPAAMYGGLTKVAGNWIPLYFGVFPDSGASSLSGGTPMPGALGLMTSGMGFPSVSVLNDPTAVAVSPSTITDFCTSLNVTTMLKSTVHSNPAAGTRMFLQYNASLRDTDQDGYENAIDTCPVTAAPAENPRNAVGVNDTDSDGIMNSCDTNTPTASGADVDGDGIQNRQDNCPQLANSTNAEADLGSSPADLGPRNDGIGDACDSGSLTITQNGKSVTVGGGSGLTTTVGNGRYLTLTNVVPKCFGGVDADGDGYCTTATPGVNGDAADSGSCATTTPNSCFVRHSLWLNAPTHPALQMDTDGDTLPPPGVGATNLWTDAVETYLGTDATKPCAQTRSGVDPTPNTNDEGPLDNWPTDFDDNGFTNVGDYLKYNTILGTAAGGFRAVNGGGDGNGTTFTPATLTHPALGGLAIVQTRFDLNLDGFLNSGDLGKFNAYMNLQCGTHAGAPPKNVNGSAVFQQ